MRSVDILKSLYIFIIFLITIFLSFIISNVQDIKNNWPKYRCSPMVIPFVSFFGYDVEKNFTSCIQTMQAGYMGHLLKPLHHTLGLMSTTGASLGKSINDVRAFFLKMRTLISSLTKDIFGVFYGIMIEFERMIINIKDMFQRLIAILVVQIFTLSSVMMTSNSIWKGPPGTIMRALCFHPDTLVKLKDESYVKMKDIQLNAEMYDGGVVLATMNISNLDLNNKQRESFYKISGGEDNEPIYVTGSHLIYDKVRHRFIKIEEHGDAILKPNFKSKTLSCLITSNHIIRLGRRMFHDWEDNLAEETLEKINI